jgi:hypothetical protein
MDAQGRDALRRALAFAMRCARAGLAAVQRIKQAARPVTAAHVVWTLGELVDRQNDLKGAQPAANPSTMPGSHPYHPPETQTNQQHNTNNAADRLHRLRLRRTASPPSQRRNRRTSSTKLATRCLVPMRDCE